MRGSTYKLLTDSGPVRMPVQHIIQFRVTINLMQCSFRYGSLPNISSVTSQM